MMTRLVLIVLCMLAASAPLLAEEATEQAAASETSVTVFPPSWPIDSFTLVDQRGDELNEAWLKDKWTFVVFGFTQCGPTCVSSLSTLDEVEARLAETPGAKEVQMLFISLDPARDTPEAIDAYLGDFGDAVVGATGSTDTLRELANQLGVSYRPSESRIAPSAKVLLIDPDANLRVEFSPPLKPATLAAEYQKVRGCPDTYLVGGRMR